MKNFFLVFLAIFFLSSCSKLRNKDFEDRTLRNEIGNQVGGNGLDWKLNEEFSNTERDLFDEIKPLCEDNADEEIIFYPNPIDQIGNLILQIELSHANIRIVDKNFKVLYSQDSIALPNFLTLDFQDILDKNENSRLYYQLVGEDCELRGFGNIIVE